MNVEKFRVRVADWGFRRASYHQVMCLLQKLVYFEFAYVSASPERRTIRDLDPPEFPQGYDTRIVDLSELKPFIGEECDLTRDFLDRAIANGDECTANFYEGRLVGYGFNAYRRALVTDQIDVIVPTGFRYGYKAWTHPDHRRKQLARIRGYVRRQQRPSAYTESSVWYVATHNYPSLLHSYRHPRERSVRMGYVGFIRLFGRDIPFNSRKANWIGFRFVRKNDNRVYQYVN